MDSSSDQKRSYFRIPYPLQYRPKITFNHQDYFSVIDLSERGVRFEIPKDKTFSEISIYPEPVDFAKISQEELKALPEIRGEVIFKNKESFEIAGKIIRVKGRESVLFLSLSIPFQKIMREQIELRRRFAGFT